MDEHIQERPALTSPVLLYDGTCGFCSSIVAFVLRHERTHTLHFASLDSAFATRLREVFPELRTVDSVVWLDADGARVHLRSDAIIILARYLGGPWRVATAISVLPRALRDWGYDRIARHRHLLAPDDAGCFIPPANVRQRFLDEGFTR